MRTPRIKIMPDWLQNQIAAGEVVERPASVVKELLENAMDAGATRITVEVEQGGKRLIRVVDNGSGMSGEEALLALERHATSKCSSIEDLRAIGTFGFRGEALPSIASVSRFTLRSRPAGDDAGIQVEMPEGREKRVEDVSMAVGTEVRVADLFFNVPARRKFLKTDATEQRNIVEVVQRMALSNHDVHFTLVTDGRKVLTAPPEKDRMARIYAIMGKKICEHLYECYVEGRIAVHGFISEPDTKKRGAGSLFTFVNGRFVRDKLIIQAILNGYSTLLGRGEYPYAVLDIHVPPGELDVNVHPAKAEVRFERANEVFSAIARAVRLTVSEAPWVSGHLVPQSAPDEASPRSEQEPTVPGGPSWSPRPERGEPWRPAARPALGGRFAGGALPREPVPLESGPPAGELAVTRRKFANMRYLGQFANCYLLGQIGDTLVVVDQHAAHERVMFERLRREFDREGIRSQVVLVPELLELEPALLAAVEARAEALARLGFALEPFGGNTVAVKAVPMLLKQKSAESAVRAILEELSESDDQLSSTTLFHKPISTMACHSAVRAGDPMQEDEVRALFAQMDEVDLAAYCPHGRPVVVFLREEEVARWFHRS